MALFYSLAWLIRVGALTGIGNFPVVSDLSVFIIGIDFLAHSGAFSSVRGSNKPCGQGMFVTYWVTRFSNLDSSGVADRFFL